MNILINCSNLRVGGGLQVAHSFISEIKQYPEHRFVVAVSSKLVDQLDFAEFEKYKHITFKEYTITPSLKKAITGKDQFLTSLEKNENIDRVFTVFGPSYWRPSSRHICGYAKPQYVYPTSPFFDMISWKTKISLETKKHLHLRSFDKTSDVMITELWDVSEKLKELLPNKEIHTVTNTYNQVFEDHNPSQKLLPAFDGTTLLTISAYYKHKNLEIIPPIISILKKKYPDFKFRFVLTLEEHQLKIDDKNLKKHIEFIGRVNIEDCPGLYQQANFMFLPTLLECFSASYPEAMVMDTPILTSDLPFAHSICGPAAEFFDPMDPADIADKIFTLSQNPLRRDELIKAGQLQLKKFDTAESRARKYIEIITK